MSASAAPSRARSTVSRPVGAVDGEVEYVDPVGHGPVDGGHQVGGRAAVVAGVGGGPAGLVDRQPRLRRGAGVAPGPLARDPHGDAGVAGGDRGHQGAVAVVVERRQAGGGAHAGRRRSRRRTTARRRSCGRTARRPSPARRRSCRGSAAARGPRPRTSAKSGAVGPQAGVDHADHHAGAAATCGRRRRPSPAGAGSPAASRRTAFALDRDHAPGRRRGPGLGGVRAHGVAVEGGRPAVDRDAGADRGEGGVLRRRARRRGTRRAGRPAVLPAVPGPVRVTR